MSLGPEIGENFGFYARNFSGKYEHPRIGHNQFQNTPYRVAKCRDNRLGDVEKYVDEKIKLECGPMPIVMAAQPNIGGVLCESSVLPFLVPRRKVWLTHAAGVPCSKAANKRRQDGRKVNFAPGKISSGAKARRK